MTKKELQKIQELENLVASLTLENTELKDRIASLESRNQALSTAIENFSKGTKQTKSETKTKSKTTKTKTKTSTKSKSNDFDRDLYVACAKELGVYSETFHKVPKEHRQKVYDLMAIKSKTK